MRIILIFIFLFAVWAWFTGTTLNSLDANIEDMKSKIGTEFVLEGDTLLIIDYSTLNDNYTLSNGTKVSKELIK